MTNFNEPNNVADLIGLWDFLSGNETADTGLDDGIAQNGNAVDGNGVSPSFSNDQLHVGGGSNSHPTVFDVNANINSSADDEQFNLDRGTLEVQFTQSSHSGSSEDVILSRGEKHIDAHDEGFFEIRVTAHGSVQSYHNTDKGDHTATLCTSNGFFSPGDVINVKYAFDEATGARLTVENLTTGAVESLVTNETGLTFDLTDDDDEEFTFGARESDDGVYDKEFQGSIDYVALYTTTNDPVSNPLPEGEVVDGENAGELMTPGYDDSNAPTDGGGQTIDGADGDEDIIMGNGGDDTIDAGQGDDLVSGGSGDDEIDGNVGNDTIYGDQSDAVSGDGAAREVFQWDLAPNTGAPNFSQDTGSVTVTFTETDGGASDNISTDTQNVAGIDTGTLGAVDATSSLDSETGGHGKSDTYALGFSDPVENVSFRVNDIDGDGVVRIKAFDENGAPIEVILEGGSHLTQLDTDGVTGNDTADSNGGYLPDTSDEYSVLVTIPGPVSEIQIFHTQDGSNNSGINVTDVYFDVGGVVTDDGAPGNDAIDGGEGDDLLYGQDGDDTLTGGEGADDQFGGDGDDTFIVGSGAEGDGDTIDGGNGPDETTDNDVLDLRGAGPVVINAAADANDDGATAGTVTFEDGSVLTFEGIETIQTDPVNEDPDAVDDANSGDEDTDITGNVLANDTDPNAGDTLTVISNTDPSNGTVTVDPNGDYTYTPNENFNGEDTFTYTVSDSNGGTDTATVTITVDPVNDAPDAVNDSATTPEDTAISIDVLDNDTDVDGDTLEIIGASVPSNEGTVDIVAGELLFTPAENFNGDATITYTISDGNGGTDTADLVVTVTPVNDDPDAVDDGDSTEFETAVEINLLANDSDVDNPASDLTVTSATVPASEGTLTPTGTEGVYTFTPAAGFEGTATVSYTISDGAGGTDSAVHTIEVGADPTPQDGIVDGEESGELMNPGYDDSNLPTDQGGDIIDGPDGLDDVIEGNGGDDTINAGLGSDTVSGGTGDDEIFGGATDDGDDLSGDEGDDTLQGGGGDDTLDGGVGDDVIEGGTGDDDITGGDGADSVDGGDGNDTIDTSGDNDLLDAGWPGYGPIPAVAPDGDPDDDKDTVNGGAGDDSITTGDDADVIDAGTGNDTIDAGIDDDSVLGGGGEDLIIGSEGNDTLSGGGDDDTIFGGLETPAPDGVNLADDGFGAPFGPDPDPLNNADVIDGGAGNDLIFGQDDADTITGGTGDDTIDGGVDDDSILGGQGDDVIEGGHGQDFIQGNNDDDLISGGRGSDTLEGNAGDDTIIGGAGDSIIGGGDADSIFIDQDEVDENGDNDTGIFVEGNTFGDDNDTLDLTDFVAHRNLVETPDGDGDSTSGSVEVQNDEGEWVEVTFGEIENLLLPPQAPDMVVDGEEFGEVMDPLYDDSNGPTDGGGDIIDGPDGDDDSIRGNGGDDTINAGEGDDTVDGGADNDSVLGGNGDDIVDGGDGDDTVRGEDGNDTVSGGDGDDSVTGGAGDDVLDGGDGDDSLTGGSGDDEIDGGLGNDSITGSTGADTITDLDGDNLINSDNPGSFNPDLGVPIPTAGGTGPFIVTPPDADPDDNKDSITTGAGNDTINAGDDADVIDAGDGDNVVDGGTDADTITTGSGNDSIVGGEGDDLINSGDGDDTIDGGVGDPAANFIDEPNDGFTADPILNNGDDTINAGAGNDLVNGEDDNDVIDGGTGDDTLDGGIDDDTVLGGEGDDIIIGGQGADSLDGGLGDDVFNVGTFTDPNGTGDYQEGVGDTIVGGEDPGDGDTDTLDLTGSGSLKVVYEDSVDPTGTPGESGTVIFYTDDTQTEESGRLTFKEIENVIPCFTPGAMIATPRGEVPVETLREGDKVITRDNGIQEIRWTGNRTLNRQELAEGENLKPILIKAGSLGRNLPERDMLVSPQHRVLITGESPQLYFEESEVLVAAKHLVGKQGVSVVDTMRTTYIHFMFDRHEVVLSDGAWTESFQPGDQTLGAMSEEIRAEIIALFPELATEGGLTDYAAARRSLKAHEAKLLRL